jgi:3-oxoacyl-[acyl-carrier-protein] synthase II
MLTAVEGLACLGSFGGGIAALSAGKPLLPAHPDGRAAEADLAPLKDRFPARALRQMDRFSRLALLGACMALEDAGIAREALPPDTGIILATGYGPATPTFNFLDSLLTHGESMASPLAFSHSVQNIPAASLALALNLTGPCLTLCQRDNPGALGLLTARQWLAEGRAQAVLFAAVDEHTPLLAEATRAIVAERGDRLGSRAALPLGEGAACFLLTSANSPGKQGAIRDIHFGRGPDLPLPLPDGETLFLSGAIPPAVRALPGAVQAAPLYGNIPVPQAFDLALALAGRQPAALCLAWGSNGVFSGVRIRAHYV